MSIMRNPISIFDSEGSDTDASATVKGPVKYRLAVLTKLPGLKILDSIAVTAEEVTSAKQLATDLFNEDSGENIAGLDEDKLWKYPEGWTPPKHVISDSTKKASMRRTQRAIEEAVIVLPKDRNVSIDKTGKISKDLPLDQLETLDAWTIASNTRFELSKRTIWRYHEV